MEVLTHCIDLIPGKGAQRKWHVHVVMCSRHALAAPAHLHLLSLTLVYTERLSDTDLH